MFSTPILFLIFNRVDVTQKVFDQIKKVRPKYLYVAADGPRKQKDTDIIKCEETRRIIDQVDWDCEVQTLFRTQNMGCGPAVATAISWFFEQVESGIVLEDDCFPNTTFFPYCEELLEKYKDAEQIKFIGGNNFQNGQKRGEASYYLSRYPTSWGWASWRRSWQAFNPDISDCREVIESGQIDNIFNTTKEKKHWINSLVKASNERNSVWDFYFYFAIWKRDGLCITPNKNLVINLGFFDQGTHYFLKDSTKTNVKAEEMDLPMVHPDSLQVNRQADRYTFDHFYSHSPQRAFRLIRENGIGSILRYFYIRFIKEND
ncbi:nucleotide-diphospho-sugar transferase [Dyadobacter sp. CY323]|uniref:nucleotide-diphospho-sugar transferase n=1 Tax=Dyadobacter sp. CY323 TaxID=2907302 RepID=UPI001F3C55FF|nr:nucleotide-diphospho-sugar transferase [Dyadobacter sp. CY323]MCE6991391.1 nucleotide-diphospho-sugar transferase [Dyadobacter sp. CY323]